MDSTELFLTTFLIVFIGELGDKTQIAAGTGSLAYERNKWVIFLSSSLALTCVAALTAFAAGLIPADWIPPIAVVGGVLLVLYGTFLLYRSLIEREVITANDEEVSSRNIFITQFLVVFLAELGDKTQIATLAIAVDNQEQIITVFLGSALALLTVTGLTVWGVSFLPRSWIKRVQVAGAILLILYGIYMVV